MQDIPSAFGGTVDPWHGNATATRPDIHEMALTIVLSGDGPCTGIAEGGRAREDCRRRFTTPTHGDPGHDALCGLVDAGDVADLLGRESAQNGRRKLRRSDWLRTKGSARHPCTQFSHRIRATSSRSACLLHHHAPHSMPSHVLTARPPRNGTQGRSCSCPIHYLRNFVNCVCEVRPARCGFDKLCGDSAYIPVSRAPRELEILHVGESAARRT